MFRDAIRRFVERLERSGGDATSIEERRMFHVFRILMPWADASAGVHRAVGELVRGRVAGRSSEASEGRAL